MKNPICCICGKECENKYGNDPYPLNKKKIQDVVTLVI